MFGSHPFGSSGMPGPAKAGNIIISQITVLIRDTVWVPITKFSIFIKDATFSRADALLSSFSVTVQRITTGVLGKSIK